jgi:murein DD-endopeptidase MepM/ murein hydrolase activator NlpD
MKSIEKLLKEKGLFFKNSIEEYTDHFTSMYEDHLLKYEAKQAELYIQVAINRLDSKQINQDYLKLYYKNKFIMLASISSILCIFFLNFPQADPPSIQPLKYTANQVSSAYGMRTHPVSETKVLHKGIDIKAKTGTHVVATSAGVIVKAEYSKKNGYFIEIKHDATYSTRYLHLSKLDVEANDKIELGQKIGEVGSTGLSSAPHLHYEVLENGKAVDPAPYMKS